VDLSSPARLSASQLLAYAAPTVALQAMMVPLLMFLPPTYSQVAGLSLATVGLMFAIGRTFEALTDPLIGALSDRTTFAFGRRRTWMAVGTPIAIVATYFLLTPDPDTSALYLLLWLVVFYAGWTLVFIPHQTWGGEMTGDYHERTRIAGFRETGSFVGYLAAALVPLVYLQLILGKTAPTFEEIVKTIGWFFAVFLPIGVVWCLVKVPAVKAAEGESLPSWTQLFAILRRNKPFARLVTAYFIDRLAMGTYFFVQPILITFALGMPQHLLWISLANTLAAVLFSPLWVPVTRKFGKHRAYCLANGVTMLSYLLLFVAQPGDLWLVALANAVMGLGNGGTMITPPAMAADTVDHDELQSGVQQMGGHMAFLAFVFKAGMAFGPLIGAACLGYFGYQQSGQALDAESMLGIRICASVLPILLLVVPMAMMWRFPIDSTRHAEIRRMLEARRAA
jgi:GPH family glycoside/pentoside/hexuronide:cation symporter